MEKVREKLKDASMLRRIGAGTQPHRHASQLHKVKSNQQHQTLEFLHGGLANRSNMQKFEWPDNMHRDVEACSSKLADRAQIDAYLGTVNGLHRTQLLKD